MSLIHISIDLSYSTYMYLMLIISLRRPIGPGREIIKCPPSVRPCLRPFVMFLQRPSYLLRYYNYSFQICRIYCSIKNLAWVSFWANCENKMAATSVYKMAAMVFFISFFTFPLTPALSLIQLNFFSITYPGEFWCPSIFWGFCELWFTFKWTAAVLPNIIKCLITVKLVHLQYFAQICS